MREPPLMVRWAQRSPSEVDWCHYLLHSGPLKSRARSNGLIACVSDFGRPFCDWNPSSCWQKKKKLSQQNAVPQDLVLFFFVFQECWIQACSSKHSLFNHPSSHVWKQLFEAIGNDGTFLAGVIPKKKKKNCPCKHPGHASVSEQQRKYTATKNHPFNLGWEREKKNKLQETTSNLMIHSCNISISS